MNKRLLPSVLMVILLVLVSWFFLAGQPIFGDTTNSVTLRESESVINDVHCGSNCSYVTLWFDDGYSSTYEKAFPELQKRTWIGVVAMIADRNVAADKFAIYNDPIMSWQQVDELVLNGWEISSHSNTHPFLNDVSEVSVFKEEIVVSKHTLEDLGYSVNSFTFPYGQNGGSAGQELVSSNYKYWRSSQIGVNPLPAWRHITANSVESDTTIEEVEVWLQEAQSGWLVINIHNIQDDLSNDWAISPEFFYSMLEAIEGSGAQVYEAYGYAEDYQ